MNPPSPVVLAAAHLVTKAASSMTGVAHVAHQVMTTGYLGAAGHLVAFGTLPPTTSGDFTTIKNWMLGVGGVVAVGSLIAVAVMMIGDHGQASGQRHGSKLVKVFAGFLLLGSATAIGAALLPS